MKKLIYLFTAALITVTSTATAFPLLAASINNTRNSGDRYLFVEGGIEFSVYPDGEFDFVLPELINDTI